MFLLHIGYGLGALIANQLARPFIKQLPEDPMSLNGTLLNATSGNFSLSDNTTLDHSHIWNPIEIPYLIVAAYTFLFAVHFLVFYIIERIKRSQEMPNNHYPVADVNKPSRCDYLVKNCTSGKDETETMYFLFIFFSCMFVYFFTAVGVEQSFSKFLYSYAIESGSGFTRSEASNLHTLFWLCFMSGRTIMIPISLFVRPDVYTMAYVNADVICTIVLSVFGARNVTVLWVFSALFGLAHGPLAPNAFGWCNLYVVMSGARVAAVTVACAIGQMSFQWVTGYVFEYHGAQAIMYINLVHAGLLMSSFIGAFFVARRKGQRFTTVQSELTEDTDQTTGLKQAYKEQ